MRVFDPLAFELDGVGVIEASAGTGKTFSVTKLYLRILLERGADVEQIVVATFTEAAAAELSGRIFANLQRAAALAGGAPARDDEDHQVEAILDQARERRSDGYAPDRELRLALLSFDRAPIGTLHAFCHRVLADFAFHAAQPLAGGRVGSGEAELVAAFRRLWHRRLSAGQPAWQRLAVDRKLAGAMEDIRRLCAGGPRIEEMLSAQAAEREAALARLAAWRDQQRWRQEQVALQVLEQLCAGEPVTEEALEGLPLPSALAADARMVASQSACHFDALVDGALTLRRSLARDVASQRLLTFDAIVEQFAAAVRDSPELGESVWRAHPWALVDEFQDTSYDQTDALLRIWGRRERGGLTMIGDPKQAIYGFRGGDVHAYLRSCRHATHQATLDRNYRSTPALLDAINRIFDGRRNPFIIGDVGYQRIESGDPQRLAGLALRDGLRPTPALSIWFQSESRNAGDYEAECRDAVVAEIGRLLRVGRIGAQPVAPGNFAVLVRTNRQGLVMQEALTAAGIPAVCVGDQSVFVTDQAAELLVVLRAMAEPGDDRLLRAALATPLFGADLDTLRELAQDEDRLDAQRRRFEQLHAAWRRSGVLAALYPVIAAAGPRILTLASGPRQMTNWLHLTDLLQQSQAGRIGLRALIGWLEQNIRQPDAGAETQKLRLESDDEAVQISTIHRSKGLQYDVVFAPFLWSGRGRTPRADKLARPEGGPLRWHDDDHELQLDLGGAERSQAATRRFVEDLAEELRLAYVALTRGRSKVYTSWGNLAWGAWLSSVPWLFCEDGTRNLEGKQSCQDGRELERQLRCIVGRSAQIQIQPPPAASVQAGFSFRPPAPQLEAHPITAIPFDDWTITSFSRLVAGGTGAPADPLETHADDAATMVGESGGQEVFAELAGARFGNFIHHVLEQADFETLAVGGAGDLINRLLRRHAIHAADSQRATLPLLFREVVRTPLDATGVRLVDIPATARIAEMEFHLSLARCDLRALRELLSESPWGRRCGLSGAEIEHPYSHLNGMLNGFIDLVYEHGGRYYVADYKSNLLGGRVADYRDLALRQAMIQHRYHLQYFFYTLALHRYLRQWQPGYSYDRHFGGVRYLFVRGMRAALGPAAGILSERPETDLVLAADDLLGGSA